MSVVRVTRINLSGDVSATDHSYVHTYEVEVSSRNDQQATVLQAAGIPNLGQQHPSDPAAVVTSKRARLRDERLWKLWAVDVNYAIVQGNEDAVTRDPTQPPDLRAAELRIRSAQSDEVIVEDIDGKPLWNSAADLFPAHLRTVTRYYAIISYRRWFRAADLDPYRAVLAWTGKFNGAAWYTADARTIQIHGLTFERELWQNQLFYRTDFELAGPLSDTLRIANEGLHVKTGFNVDGVLGKKPVMMLDKDDNGNPTGLRYRASEPVPLQPDGKKPLPEGQPPQILEFRVYGDIDFAAIGL